MAWLSFLLVGCGGALGAVLRYAIGLIPVRSEFPVLTLCINFFGAAAIGLIAETAAGQQLSARSTLFWKTGVCGGFTTFPPFAGGGDAVSGRQVGSGQFVCAAECRRLFWRCASGKAAASLAFCSVKTGGAASHHTGRWSMCSGATDKSF